MNITVYCASSECVADVYYEAAEDLGRKIANHSWGVVYGGTSYGLMKHLALGALRGGGRVVGIIAECIARQGGIASNLTETIVTADMKERKAQLRNRGDAFIVLPGGWGTLEEISEVITLKQLGVHNKPIVFININGYYDGLLTFLAGATESGFISASYDGLYAVVSNVEDALKYIENYVPIVRKIKYESQNV